MIDDLIEIDKKSKISIHEQLTTKLIKLIKAGVLKPNQKLPSSRSWCQILGIHRKTLLKAQEELILQGWLISHIGKGTFVTNSFKDFSPELLVQSQTHGESITRFEIGRPGTQIQAPFLVYQKYHLDDGLPDPRIAPLSELATAYKSVLNSKRAYIQMGYADTWGNMSLRNALVGFLNETRGLNISVNEVMITKGITQAFYLSSLALLTKGDYCIVGELSWQSAKSSLLEQGFEILKVAVDNEGLVVEQVEDMCEKYPIRFLYATPHHHYPTTVIMSASRRLQLLALSRKYGFLIFEDDYDFDFHFEGRPILPMASVAPMANVLYAGSFTKAISPAFRVGYLVGEERLLSEIAKIRRIVDRQGDEILEAAIAHLLNNQVIQRYLRKARRVYLGRRDIFCDLLKSNLKDEVNYEIPTGGMSVWTKFDSSIDLNDLAQKGLKSDLYFSDGKQHNSDMNATRLGFASSNEEELYTAVSILKRIIHSKH